jgi:hypothetical protein
LAVGYHGLPVVINTTNAHAYGRLIGKRYAGLPKILGGDSNRCVSFRKRYKLSTQGGVNPLKRFWSSTASLTTFASTGDPAYVSNLTITDSGNIWNEIAEGIIVTEGVDAFITYHSTVTWIPGTPEARASSYFGDKAWLTLDAIQSGHNPGRSKYIVTSPPANGWISTYNYESIEIMYSVKPTRPCIDLENHYEYWPLYNNVGAIVDRWNSSFVRNGEWHAVS